MQIHEITRRKLNEAGFAQGLAGGLSSAFGQVGVAGLDMDQGGNTGPSMNRSQAYAAAVAQAKTLMPLMQKSWGQIVQKIMSTSKDSAGVPITSLKQLNPAEMDNLEAGLDAVINKSFGASGSYTQLPNMTSDEQAKAGAQKIVLAISTAKNAILDAAKEGTDASAAWQDLMTDGIAPAMNFLSYDRGAGGDIDLRVKRGSMPPTFEVNLGNGSYVPFDRTDPKHAQVATMLGFGADSTQNQPAAK